MRRNPCIKTVGINGSVGEWLNPGDCRSPASGFVGSNPTAATKCKDCITFRKKLTNARIALKVICTWASYSNGDHLVAKEVVKLCKRNLRETEYELEKQM